MDFEKILETDTLNQGRVKINNILDDMNSVKKDFGQTMINKYKLGPLNKGAQNSSTVISYTNNNQNYNVKMQGSSGYMYISGILGKYRDLKNKKLELYILNNSDAFNIIYYLSKGADWNPANYPKFVSINVKSGQNKITIDISKIINNDFNYTNENTLYIGFRKDDSSQTNLDFTFFICEIGAETVSFDNKIFNKADYSISAGDSVGKLDDRLLALESGQFKKNKLTLGNYFGRKQYDNNYFEYSNVNNNYCLKFNKTNGYVYVSGILGKYRDFKNKTITLYANVNIDMQLTYYLSKGADWNPNNYPKFGNVNVKKGANSIEINVFDLINGDSNYADSNVLFFGIRDQIKNSVDVEITFYLTEKLLNENRDVVNYADFALNAAGDLENRLTNLEIATQKSKYITCWGDSLTAMGGWTTELANLSGLPVHNGGTGGENVKTIVARQGADAMMVNNLTIPADTSPVLIATKNQGISTILGNKSTPLLQGGAHVNPCYIGDIKGTLRWTGSNYADTNGTWTFSRESSGSEVVINRPTAIRTDFDINRNAPYLMVIFIGQNGGYDNVDDLIHWHKLMINHANTENVLILGLSSGTKEERKEYESKMKSEFGRYFISLREYLSTPIYNEDTIISCYGLEDAGLTATQNDLTAIATGKVPPQLLMDSVHYTESTRKVIGRLIYKRAKELNIF